MRSLKLVLVISFLLYGSYALAAPSLLDQMRALRFEFMDTNIRLALAPGLDTCKCYDAIMVTQRKNVKLLDMMNNIIMALGGSKDLTREEIKKLESIEGWWSYK